MESYCKDRGCEADDGYGCTGHETRETVSTEVVAALLDVAEAAQKVNHFTGRDPDTLPPMGTLLDLSAALDRLGEVRRD